MKNFIPETCPNCGYHKLKSWRELSDDEKILIEKLLASAEFTSGERKRHRWCARCQFEVIN